LVLQGQLAKDKCESRSSLVDAPPNAATAVLSVKDSNTINNNNDNNGNDNDDGDDNGVDLAQLHLSYLVPSTTLAGHQDYP